MTDTLRRPYVKRGLRGLESRRASRLAYVLKPERVCPGCKVLKPLAGYRRKEGSMPSAYCNECKEDSRNTPEWRAYYAAYRQRFKDKINAQKRLSETAARDLRRRLIDKAKGGPCVDCGMRYPAFVMDLDHRDPSTKKFALAKASRSHTRLEDIRAEIAKCDVVCANCHRYRTHMQLRAKHPHLVNGRA